MRLPSRLIAVLTGAIFFAGIAVGKDDDEKPRRRVRLGGVQVGFNYFNGPAWGFPYYGYGYYPGFSPYWSRAYLYDPFWYSPWIHPGLYNGFGYGPNMGEVKLNSPDKEASVYVDGAYAGPASKLKSMWLEPGAYNLEVKDSAGLTYQRRVYVLTGKTLEIRAELKPPKEPGK